MDSFGAYFLSHLASDPDQVFAEHGARIATRAEVSVEARHLARDFAAAGIGPRDCVGLACLDPLRAIEATIALWSLGAAPVFLDTRQPPGYLDAAAKRVNARTVYSDITRFGGMAGIRTLRPVSGSAEGLEPLTFPADAPTLPAVWLSSSGTTKVPVYQPRFHASCIVRMIDGEKKLGSYPLPPSLAVGSLAFGAVAWQWLRAIKAGSKIISLPVFFRIEELDAAMRRPDVEFAGLPPVILRDLLALHRGRDTALEGPAYPNLRRLVSLGGPIGAADLKAVRDLLTPRIRNLYSLTNVGPVSYLEGDAIDTHPSSVGRLLPGVSVTIGDADGAPLPAGQLGHIIATNISEKSPPVATGDIGYFDQDGFLYITGRSEKFACRKSVTISLAHLEESVLARDGVRDCCAFAVRDRADGGDKVALAIESSLAASELISWLRAEIPASIRPDYLWVAGALSRTASGKISLLALQELMADEYIESEHGFVRI